MVAQGHSIRREVRDVLASSAVVYDGPRITIKNRLDDALWTQVKAVLKLLEAVYAPRKSAFRFAPDEDAERIVRTALAAGRIWRRANVDGFVPTPPDLAEEVIGMHANIPLVAGRRLRILEPSAGTGSLVAVAAERYGTARTEIVAVEPDARRAAQIEPTDHVSIVVDTFEAYAQRAAAAGERFDLFIMNPPFAVRGHAEVWVAHVRDAWALAAPGARLMAIVPDSVLDHRRGGRIRKAYELVQRHGHARRLDPDAFAAAGVTFGTAVVWLDRPLVETRALHLTTGRHPAVFRSVTGDETPIRVTRPYLTRAAAETMPVQSWPDWQEWGKFRTLRYRGDCVTCTTPLWSFDDGGDDPRGVLRVHSACASLRGKRASYASPGAIGLCVTCADDEATRARAQRAAQELWDGVEPAPQAGRLALQV